MMLEGPAQKEESGRVMPAMTGGREEGDMASREKEGDNGSQQIRLECMCVCVVCSEALGWRLDEVQESMRGRRDKRGMN